MFNNYLVKDGENIKTLASKFNISVQDLMRLNNLYFDSELRAGMEIIVPKNEDKSFNSGDYLFHCSGHHGIIWSLIASDSSRIHLYNGTTRKHIEHANLYSFDTLSFINDNINTINWGIDSLDNAAQALTPLNDEAYNPIYNELYIIKENKIVFCSNNADYYSGPDSTIFNHHLSKLSYLMYWLAAPSCRPYLPVPCDTIFAK